jgi:hypothetical protein
MTQTANLAVAADYADAMLVARRAKNWLFLLLLLALLVQIGIFFVARFVPTAHLTATIQTAGAATAVVGEQRTAAPLIRWLIAMTDFLGIAMVIILAIVLLLIVGIMLVGRLVGVTHVTAAFVWCIVLAVLLLPWQTLLNSDTRTIRLLKDWRGHSAGELISTDGSSAAALIDVGAADNAAGFAATTVPDVRVPGVLYTWPELARDYDFSNTNTKLAILKWTRFVGFPVLALIMLMTIQVRSSRGLRYALGESEMPGHLTNPMS